MNSNATNNNLTTLPSTPAPQTSKEVIAANVKLLIEQLEAGHSEGLTAYLTAMGRFHSYSFGNILEIARQKPDATRVAGLYAWNQLGRKVSKGQKGIRILAPMIGTRRKKDTEAPSKDTAPVNQPVLLRALVNLDPYTFADDLATDISEDPDNEQRSTEEVLLAAIEGTTDEKLTSFAARLALAGHRGIPREDELDFLTEAEAAFLHPKPKKNTPAKKEKKPTLVKPKAVAKKAKTNDAPDAGQDAVAA